MFDFESIQNLIIILIPVAIVLTRFIRRFQKKQEPPPKKPPQPYIPVHFEDEASDHFQAPPKPSPAIKRGVEKTVATPFTPKAPLSQTTPAEKTTEPQEFGINLNHLSRLKQAVVMAEILGKPKGLINDK